MHGVLDINIIIGLVAGGGFCGAIIGLHASPPFWVIIGVPAGLLGGYILMNIYTFVVFIIIQPMKTLPKCRNCHRRAEYDLEWRGVFEVIWRCECGARYSWQVRRFGSRRFMEILANGHIVPYLWLPCFWTWRPDRKNLPSSKSIHWSSTSSAPPYPQRPY